ncbi:MAG: TonB-dependent receptor [Methylococcales bacterium]
MLSHWTHNPDKKVETIRQQTLPLKWIKQGILVAPLLIGNVYAVEEQTYRFDLPAQPLSTTLDNVAQSAHTKLVYSDTTVKGLTAVPVKGEYTATQALTIALGKSGLGYKVVDKTLITVIGKPTPAPETTLKAMTVVGTQESSDPYNEDYRVINSKTATKTDTPILETPYSVSVVPQQVLKDKQVIRVEDALTSVAGVQSSFTNGGLSDVFIIRGFQNTSMYLDGFLLPSALGGGTSKREVANLEQIEVLKGPGSILYGRSEPGGIINLTTKRPQATSYNAIQQQFGSYGMYRTAIDSTGKMTKDDILLYRVNLSYENANSFRDFVKTDDFFIAPSLTWNISDKTQANLDITYQYFNNTSDSGIPPMGNRPAPVPINFQMGEPNNNKNVGDRVYVGANWSHAFNDSWKLNHRFGAEFLDLTQDFTFFFSQPDASGNFVNINANPTPGCDGANCGTRGFNNAVVHQQNYYTTLNLTGKFKTSVLEHNTLWGFDYFVIDNQSASSNAQPLNDTFNIFNPIYQTTASPSTFTTNPKFNQEWYGLYAQDQIKFPFNVYGNVGVRYDNATSNQYTNPITLTTTDDHFSPRGGLLWKPVQWLSVYGNYSENFGPSNNLFNVPGQQIIPPQLANQWELGAKTEFFNKRLSTTFAYFDLTKTNVPVYDPTNWLLQRASGKQESRGYEFEVAGEALPGLKTVAAYTILDYAKVVLGSYGGVNDETGNRMFNTPRNYGSLWNTYEFQNASLRGLKIGGGIVASAQSQGTNYNDFQLPGYVTLNLLTSYGVKIAGKQLTFQLNANNLLDKHYYTGTNTGNMIGVGSPRMFMGSVKLEF